MVSPLRLKPGNWAGAFACWGLENREAAVRLFADTPGNPHGANVELKCIDGSANPYLAAAVVLGLALDGIARSLPLPAGGARSTRRAAGGSAPPLALAADPGRALDALEPLRARPRPAGDLIVDGTLAVRRYEQRTYGDADPEDVAAVCRLAFSC